MKNHPELTVERFHAKRKYIEGNEYPPESQEERMMIELPETRSMVNQWFDEDDLKPRTQLDFAQYTSSFGVDIGEEIVCQKELHLIVNDMKVKLVDEKKILEGTVNPEYGKNEWTLPHIERTIAENELSNFNPAEQQWKNDSQNGCSTTDPTHTSTSDSNSSSAFAGLFNQSCPIAPLRIRSTRSRTSSCSENLDASGNETDAMNESSECTVPMISAPMLGMPNEARWSPPLRSMESLGLHQQGVML